MFDGFGSGSNVLQCFSVDAVRGSLAVRCNVGCVKPLFSDPRCNLGRMYTEECSSLRHRQLFLGWHRCDVPRHKGNCSNRCDHFRDLFRFYTLKHHDLICCTNPACSIVIGLLIDKRFVVQFSERFQDRLESGHSRLYVTVATMPKNS